MNKNGIVIFGGTGDLAFRKLFPALYNLHILSSLDETYKIVGVGRREYSREEYIEIIKKWTKEFSRLRYTDEDFDKFSDRIEYYKMDMTDVDSYEGLISFIENEGITGEIMYYYAVSPGMFEPISKGLEKAITIKKGDCGCGDNTKHDCYLDHAKIIIEKPFGEDLESAREINNSLMKYFNEENIYHIDHYLGKEMIINIMAIRFSNTIFRNVWNKDSIEKVEINVYETVGVETRGGYYDKNGALKDMIQNHLFQIMSIVAMGEPRDQSTEAIKKVQTNVLRNLIPIDAQDIDKNLVMGQYIGYRDEDKVDPNSVTETYVAMKLEVDSERWRNVPFILRTGKKLHKRECEVIISFKESMPGVYRNVLTIKVQPDEGVKLNFNIKKPGIETDTVEKVDMDFCQSCVLENRKNTPEAYERLLNAAIESDKTLFSQWDQIELSWNYINELIDTYKSNSGKLYMYEPGTYGPDNIIS